MQPYAFLKFYPLRALICLLILCLATAVFWSSGRVRADEDNDRHTTEEAAEETAQKPAQENTPPQPQPRDNPAFEIFVPSEQIAEDVPVPFPVDI